MANLNFPANPTTGQTHSVGDKTWQWSGVAWQVVRTSNPGQSAYDIAIANGFVGTEAQWIASLKGEKGDTGNTGPKGDTGDRGSQGDPGSDGADGTNGSDGADGVGIPLGGTTGQVLAKNSGGDYDTKWITPDYESNYNIPEGGSQGQFLGKASATSGDIAWMNVPTSEGNQELPNGGNAGQVLAKTSSANGAVAWVDPVAGEGNVPSGGTSGQVLTKNSAFDGDFVWAAPVKEIPTGGTVGQILVKNSTTDGDLVWADNSGGTGSGLPTGGTTGQVLTKNSSNVGDASWATPAVGLTDAPNNANLYGRKGGAWSIVKQSYAFTELSDAPTTYLGQGGKVLSVKSDESGLELIDVTADEGTGSLVPDYGEHLYWRILVHAITSGNRVGIQEIEFKNTSQGPDLTGTGTAICSSQEQSPDGAFDNAINGAWFSNSGQAVDGQWIGYQFPSAVSIRYVTVMGSQDYPAQSPTNFEIQYSDDGSTWTTAWAVTDPGNWNTGQYRYYHAPVGLNFTDLDDVPPTFVGQANKYLQVRSDEKGMNFVTIATVPTGGNVGQVLVKTGTNNTDYAWQAAPSSGITDAPSDGQTYGRRNAAWFVVPAAGSGGDLPDLTGNQGKYLAVNASGTAVEWVEPETVTGGTDFGGKWIKGTIASTPSSDYGATAYYTASSNFTVTAGQRVEVEAYITRTTSSDASILIGNSVNAYLATHQSDGNYVLYRRINGSNTALGASGSLTTTNYAGVHRLSFTIVVGSNGYQYITGRHDVTDVVNYADTTYNITSAPIKVSIGTSNPAKCVVRYRIVDETEFGTGGGGTADYPDFVGQAGKVLAVNPEEDGVQWVDATTGGGSGGSPSFAPVSATSTGVSQDITLPVAVATKYDVDVYINGIHQNIDEYTISGTTLTLTANAAGDPIEIRAAGGSVSEGGAGGITEAPEDGKPYMRQDGEWVEYVEPVGSGSGEADPYYRMSGFFAASPAVNEVLAIYVVDVPVTIPANWSGSQAKLIGMQPTADFTLSIRKNSTTEIGTLSVNTAGVATFTTTDGTSKTLTTGDALSIHAPGVSDTITNLTWLLRGNK